MELHTGSMKWSKKSPLSMFYLAGIGSVTNMQIGATFAKNLLSTIVKGVYVSISMVRKSIKRMRKTSRKTGLGYDHLYS